MERARYVQHFGGSHRPRKEANNHNDRRIAGLVPVAACSYEIDRFPRVVFKSSAASLMDPDGKPARVSFLPPCVVVDLLGVYARPLPLSFRCPRRRPPRRESLGAMRLGASWGRPRTTADQPS